MLSVDVPRRSSKRLLAVQQSFLHASMRRDMATTRSIYQCDVGMARWSDVSRILEIGRVTAGHSAGAKHGGVDGPQRSLSIGIARPICFRDLHVYTSQISSQKGASVLRDDVLAVRDEMNCFWERTPRLIVNINALIHSSIRPTLERSASTHLFRDFTLTVPRSVLTSYL